MGDPSAEEKKEKSAQIKDTIENIQNYPNLNREATNEFIKNSYYYETKGKESTPKLTLFNVGEEAESRKHDIEEVDTLPDNLGSKYVENKNRAVEAEEKDVSNVKNVEPSIIDGLKVIAGKKDSDKPVISQDLRKKTDLEKNKKVEKKKVVESPKKNEKEKVNNAKKVEAPKKVQKKIETPKKVEKVAAPKVQKIAAPKVDKVAAPKVQKVAAPKVEKVAVPKNEKVAAPKVEEPKKQKMITPTIRQP